jgi:hypothetical protein
MSFGGTGFHSLRDKVQCADVLWRCDDLSWTCRPPTVNPALRRCSGRGVKYPCYQRIQPMRVALRWRGSRAGTDTTHCPILRY